MAKIPKNTVLTIGQVAKICKVAPRTASKWFENGRLKGYRIPGSQDKRVPRENLIKFLKEHGMPVDLEDEYEVPVDTVATADEATLSQKDKEWTYRLYIVRYSSGVNKRYAEVRRTPGSDTFYLGTPGSTSGGHVVEVTDLDSWLREHCQEYELMEER